MSGSGGARELATEGQLVSAIEEMLRQRLPSSWSVGIEREPQNRAARCDANLLLRSPDGRSYALDVEVKRTVQPRDVSRIAQNFESNRRGDKRQGGVVAARYLSPSVRSSLIDAGLSYIDGTGNVYIRMDEPALYVADRGADKDPWIGPGRPKGSLKGAPAARIVRTLVDRPGSWKVRELISASGASTGSVYRVLEFLEAEGLVVRGQRGLIGDVNWSEIVRRWSLDYQFLRTNAVTNWIAVRGVDSAIDRAAKDDSESYAVTGSVAAATWSEDAPARSLMVYADEPNVLADKWGLRPAESGTNVLIAEPAYSALTVGARRRADGLRIAAPTQVVTDLLTGPGRAPSEGEELINWMEANESAWR